MKDYGIRLYYQYDIKNNNGIVKKSRKRKCHSFVKNFLYIMSSILGYMYNTIKDTGNTDRTSTFSRSYVTASASTTTYGIQAGTDITAVTINDYKLGTLILHGTTAGKLQYGACTVASPTATATVSSIVITRVFTNDSGSSITINEIGLVGISSVSGSNRNFLMIRDIPTPIVLAQGEQLTLNYILQATA